ncbi:hypothetical protein, partial [Streptomyces mirabilis]|uniref:hypothetical protein n=1 Tax=Streptomyces mirabilis TaxID=68239 RepID=UPI003333AA2E
MGNEDWFDLRKESGHGRAGRVDEGLPRAEFLPAVQVLMVGCRHAVHHHRTLQALGREVIFRRNDLIAQMNRSEVGEPRHRQAGKLAGLALEIQGCADTAHGVAQEGQPGRVGSDPGRWDA